MKLLFPFIIFVISFILRTFFLDRVPAGITDDELNFVLNAKAVFLTGSDITGVWSPFLLQPISSDFPMSELPALIMSPFVGFFSLSLLFSKLGYALINSLIPVVLYFIALRLIGKTQAVLVGIVAAFNPWGIFFGRTAYDAPLAIFFYLTGFYLLLILKGKNLLFTFIPFFLAFYSYIGTKLIFLPFIGISLFYSWHEVNKKKFTKTFILLFLLCMGVFAFFIVNIFFSTTKTRLSELSTPNDSSISIGVDNERRLSIQTPLTNAFSNKLTLWGKNNIEKYAKVFSSELLFLNGEARATFSLWFHGYFYYLDFIFLIFGIFYLFLKKRGVFFLLLTLTLISPIPTLVSNVGSGFAALRSALLFPLLCIFIGSGVYFAYTLIPSKRFAKIIVAFIAILYLILFLNFINLYFLRYTIYSSEAFGISHRILSKYLDLADEKGISVFVLAGGPKSYFNHHIFYTNSYSAKTAEKIKNASKTYPLKHSNVTFLNCDKQKNISSQTVVTKSDADCFNIPANTEKVLIIPTLSDGGKILTILNDKVCEKYALSPYPQGITFNDLYIENLNEKDFCESFITVEKLSEEKLATPNILDKQDERR